MKTLEFFLEGIMYRSDCDILEGILVLSGVGLRFKVSGNFKRCKFSIFLEACFSVFVVRNYFFYSEFSIRRWLIFIY